MRFFGLGAQVMQKLGVSTQLLAAADIYQALERGVIDATEFSMPTMDTRLGFHQIAKFNYFPGWHQQSLVQRVPDEQGCVGRTAGQLQGDDRDRVGDAQPCTPTSKAMHSQFAAMAEMQRKHGVKVKRWSDEDLAVFEKAWLEVIAGRVGQGSVVQEDRRPLPGLPQEVCHLGRLAADEGDLPDQ